MCKVKVSVLEKKIGTNTEIGLWIWVLIPKPDFGPTPY